MIEEPRTPLTDVELREQAEHYRSIDEGETLLEVQDNGKGFDVKAPFPRYLGLHSMRERAVGLGGTVELVSTPGEGTCVRVRIPSPDQP